MASKFMDGAALAEAEIPMQQIPGFRQRESGISVSRLEWGRKKEKDQGSQGRPPDAGIRSGYRETQSRFCDLLRHFTEEVGFAPLSERVAQMEESMADAYRDEGHRERFRSRWHMREKTPDESALCAALYLLAADYRLWEMAADAVKPGIIDFAAICIRGVGLEFLDRHTEGMTEKEKTVFQAALEIEKPQNMMELVNLSCNLDKYAFYEDVSDLEGLGKYVAEKGKTSGEAARETDFKAAGERYAAEHRGRFTGKGYVVRTGEAIEPVYTKEYPPTPGYDKSCVIRVWLRTPYYSAGHYNAYPLSLPASKERFALAAKNLGAEKLEEGMVSFIQCPVRELKCFLPYSKNIGEMNELAWLIDRGGALKQEASRKKLFAALEAEIPKDMGGGGRNRKSAGRL